MRSIRTLALPGLLLAASALGGCLTDVGPCDPIAARQVVYRVGRSEADPQSGRPYYAGQAVMLTSCGNGQFCHSSSATDTARYGVAAGFDFDVDHACYGELCPPFDPAVREANPDEYERLLHLHRNQKRILEWAGRILGSIDEGSMPPGREGDRIGSSGSTFSIPDFGSTEPGEIHVDGQWVLCDSDVATAKPDCPDANAARLGYFYSRVWDTIPRATTRTGREILRNWIACGAPVIENTTTLGTPGASCAAPGDTAHVGDCIVGMIPDIVPPNPFWSSRTAPDGTPRAGIYERVIQPLCGTSCHSPSDSASLERSRLDLSDESAAYDRLLDGLASGAACTEQGAPGKGMAYLVAGDPGSSLFYLKLTADAPAYCGESMIPASPTLPDSVLARIREWIEAGAPR